MRLLTSVTLYWHLLTMTLTSSVRPLFGFCAPHIWADHIFYQLCRSPYRDTLGLSDPQAYRFLISAT